MISRKKIILKSEDIASGSRENRKDSFDSDSSFKDVDDENSWFTLEQLFSDQISEIINKWSSIDDEIWGKIVCFERNRRIAKVYARSQVLSISGSDGDFDGSRIGLNAFPNFKRDPETEVLKKQIKSGFKLKIDEIGNIYIKRMGKCSIYISTADECLSQKTESSAIPKSTFNYRNAPKQSGKIFRYLEPNKAEVIFNVRKFLAQISDWSCRHPGQSLPSAELLERFHQKCIHVIQLVRTEDDATSVIDRRVLRHPCWIILVNIVGLDLLWSRFGYQNVLESRCQWQWSHQQQQHFSPRQSQPTLPSLRSSTFAFAPNRGNINRIGGFGPASKYEADSPDDLYYSGYKAKISSHTTPPGMMGKSRNTTSNCPAAASAKKQPLIGQSMNSQPCLRNFPSQIPQFNGGMNRYTNYQVPSISAHYKRLARSTTHLNFSHSTGGSNTNTNTSTSSCSSLEDLHRPLQCKKQQYSNGHSSSSTSAANSRPSHASSSSSASKLYRPKYLDRQIAPNGPTTASANYYSRHAGHSRMYNRNAEKLAKMKKLSCSNIELSSGTFYEDSWSKEVKSSDEKAGKLIKGKSNTKLNASD